jgi:hypothetical protein
MRDFNLVIPSDCVASADEEASRHALELMKRVLKADIRPSTELDLKELLRQAAHEPEAMNPQTQAPQFSGEK